jgi:PIN domain nuclease of toxin-antitoxin system
MKILLDTCAFLWLSTDAPELSEKAKMMCQYPVATIW